MPPQQQGQTQAAPQPDWFSQNAPPPSQGTTNSDWFAANAPPEDQGQETSGHWLSASGDALKGLAQGFGQGALQTTTAVSRVLNKIPVVGEALAPTAGVNAARQLATPQTTPQRIGAGAEQAAELFLPTGEAGAVAKIGMGALKGGLSTAAHEAGTTQGANPADVATGAVLGGVFPAAEASIKGLAGSKVARGMMNESMMATTRDVAYGNPAKALLDENIATPFTGDLEKFKDAIRSGATLQGAAEAAGGRISAVSQKINELAPQLNAALSKSTVKIPATVVTDTIDQAIRDIAKNRGITAADAQSAVAELNAIKMAALKVPGVPGATATAWAPLEANALKHEIGQQVDWTGRDRVGQLVEPIRKQIYGDLRDAVNAAAPGTSEINERLTNLLAAQTDINKLAGFEEVGRGRSMGGVIGPNWMGRMQALAGRFIPAASWLSPTVGAGSKIAIPANTQFSQQPQVSFPQ